jgi:hypothetical protein
MHEPLIIFVLGGGLAVVAARIRRFRAARVRDNS